MKTAKLFQNGRSQAVRLPAEFRFPGTEVFVRRDERTGDVILSKQPSWLSWDEYFRERQPQNVPDDFLSDRGDALPEDRELLGRE